LSAQLRRLSAPDTTVGGWAQTWLLMVERELKPATVRTYRTHIRYISPLACVALDGVTAEQLEAIYAQLARRRVRASTIQGVHRTFRACPGEAVRRGRLERNPALVARPGRADQAEVDPLSLGQARAIVRAAAGRLNAAWPASSCGYHVGYCKLLQAPAEASPKGPQSSTTPQDVRNGGPQSTITEWASSPIQRHTALAGTTTTPSIRPYTGANTTTGTTHSSRETPPWT
jgi:hypothetical protein